ncbi:hypothetical protein K402DRAFT_405347 [Aulographum hederae CBS 113979]|uniref:DUF1772-domain-containing protein n=1 Tax=Aulographum hederae CBS 113979 TaxID=1176131 RepID=A0A6G1GWL4_9PEZI|nr:hypothetical protein K402DRAFT_405347 [Aulographum hederae CBS 113979]
MSQGMFYHERIPASIRVVQALGITMAAFVAGETAATTLAFVPAILDAPAPLAARQWKKTVERGSTGGLIALAAGVSFGAMAYLEKPSTSAFKFFTAAAVLSPTIIPFSLLVMGPVNDKLFKKADSLANTAITDSAAESGVAKEETVHGLIDKWATLNLGNAALTFASAVCAAWAVLNPVEVVGLQGLGLSSGANRM